MPNKYPDRIRFNWGYHNGSNPKIKAFAPKSNHFDKVYVAAWYMGQHDFETGKYNGNSDAAWDMYKAEEKKEREQRRYIKNLRPSPVQRF